MLKLVLVFFGIAISFVSTAFSSEFEVVKKQDVEFEPLNPLRGDASPQAGVLWGDISKDVPTGTLVTFTKGFSSPPHIHNITYRAIVITGAVHNDDPEAAMMWMGAGSFWTQPAGESHITAATVGDRTLIFLEIKDGPYLVMPSEQAFDSGERPLNLDFRNFVWLTPHDTTWLEGIASNPIQPQPKMAFLWGSVNKDERHGSMIMMPAGSSGRLHNTNAALRAVVIRGEVDLTGKNRTSVTRLEAGSYAGSLKREPLHYSCRSDTPCLIYVSTRGRYRFKKSP